MSASSASSASTASTLTDALPGFRERLRHGRSLVRAVWDGAVYPSATCIDATCGRGSDAMQLARRAGPGGVVHALDVQPAALDETRRRIRDAADNHAAEIVLACRSHASFDGLRNVRDGSVAAVVYNLGWYPGEGADRSIITKVDTTVQSLHAAEPLVHPGGVITVTAYVGHPGGREEMEAVDAWASALDSQAWSVSKLSHPNRLNAPVVFICERV